MVVEIPSSFFFIKPVFHEVVSYTNISVKFLILLSVTDAKILERPAEKLPEPTVTDSVDRETKQCPRLASDKLFLIYL